MHPEAMQWVAYQTRNKTYGTVIDLGGRNVNGTTRDTIGCDLYIAVDIAPGDGVDVVCDAAEYRPEEPVECVVTTEMLEHTPRAADIVAAAFEMLIPGGEFIGTAAGVGRPPHSAVDGNRLREGEHYANIDKSDLFDWLHDTGFVDIQIDVQRRPADIRWTARRPDQTSV